MSEGRKFTSWQGQDLSPEYDFTDPTSDVHVIWEEVEVGGRAWKGEADIGTIPLRDERGVTGNELNLPAGLTRVSLAAHNRWAWTEQHGSNTVARGWIGPKDYMRDLEGGLRADRYREVRMSVLDANEQLKGIIVDENRGPETDVAFVEHIRSTYLDGSPDPTRVIADTWISSSNTVMLPSRRVYGDPRSVLAEAAAFANKEMFVTSDEEMFYDGWDSTAYQAGIRISDRREEWDTEAVCSPGPTAEVTGSDDHAASSQTTSMACTVPSGTGALYFAYLCRGSGFTVTGAAYSKDGDASNTQVMTLIGSIESDDPTSDTDTEALYIFRLVNPAPSTAGSPSVGVGGRVSGSTFGAALGYWTVDSTAEPTVVMAKGQGTSSTVTPAAAAGDLVLDCVGWRIWSLGNDSEDPTVTASQTEDWGRAFNGSAGQSDMAWGGGNKVGAGARTWSWTSSRYWVAAAITIPSDAPSDVATFPPIWDIGPAATEDGQQLLSGLRMYYGSGSNTYVYVTSPTTVNQYGHYEESMYAPESVTTAAAATTLAQSVLSRRRFEDRTINVSVGPLSEKQVGCVKYGQLINIKARAIAFADDQFFRGRIRQLRWTTPVPGMFFAHMQIERPIKELPYGVGNRAGSEAVTAHVLQGSNAHPEFVQRGILTSPGDIPYRGASDWTRLPIGASNTHLISDGTAPKWAVDSGGSGGGGGTGLTVPNLLNSEKASADTPDDDFDGTSLDAKWNVVDGSSGTVSLLPGSGGIYQVGARDGWLSMAVGTSSGDSVQLRQDYTLPDGSCMVLPIGFAVDNAAALANNEIQAGLCVNDNDSGPFSGTAGQTSSIMWDTEASGYRIIAWDGSTASGGLGTIVFRTAYFRISRSGLNYDMFVSTDGYDWTYIGRKTMGTAANNVWIFANCAATMANRIVIGVPWIRLGSALALDPWPL